ncbi:hypothetical protein [Actinomadura sp. 9N407]|uniref:hypothetical protein n=1 Tax=Actinomadura sp. 9N407 TaxID=3375154 RepID=UPI0037895257
MHATGKITVGLLSGLVGAALLTAPTADAASVSSQAKAATRTAAAPVTLASSGVAPKSKSTSGASGWRCERNSDSSDGDPGGISGGVNRRWKNTDAVAAGAFNAKGEKFGGVNGTGTKATVRLYVMYQPNVWEENWRFNLPEPPEGQASTDMKDRDLPEGVRVRVKVTVHNRGSCYSPILLS